MISPTFHESASCRRELHTALTAAYHLEAGSTERVMPVTWRVRPSRLRPKQLKRPRLLSRESHDVAQQAAIIAGKLARLKVADDRRFGDAPRHPDPVWYPHFLPGNKQFFGRAEVLWDLHEALLIKGKPGNQGHPVVSVRGQGGQGKTALCEQYARWFSQDHPGGVFVLRLGGSDRSRHTDPETVLSQFRLQLRPIAARLGVPPAGIAEKLADGMPYLWILDDVPSTVDEAVLDQLFAPTANGKTLVTTRGRLAKRVSVEIDLEPLDTRTGLTLLTSIRPAPEEERAAAQEIVERLGQHALGLTLAAGLTTAPGFAGYVRLRDDLMSGEHDSLEMAAHMADELPLGYAKSFSSIITRSYATLSDAGREVLAAVSVLGAAPIPLELVHDLVSTAEPGFAELSRRGLAGDLGHDVFTVHALVARAARLLFPGTYRRRLHDRACEVLGDSLEATRDEFQQLRAMSLHLPHVVALASTPEWLTGRLEWHMLNEAGRAQNELGDTKAALHSFEVLHAQTERSPDTDEDIRTAVLVGLGAAYFGQGNYTKAERVQRESVTRLSHLYGEGHPDTLQAKENLANTLSGLTEYEAAVQLLTEVYRARRDSMGKTDRLTLIALNNLVIATRHCRSHHLALRLALHAWTMWHRAAGPDMPQTLECVENIGNALWYLGRPTEAADTYQYVAQRRGAVLGPKHPDTLDAEENARVAREQTHWPVYADRLRVQGPDHPDTLRTLWRLVRGNGAQGGGEQGEPVPIEVDLGEVRLDGDQADLLSEIIVMAVEWQDAQVARYGPDDPHALRASMVLAHALAAADQYDGQIEDALTIIQESRDGLAEAAARTPDTVEPYDLEIAEILHHWMVRLAGQEPRY
ncbi:tetratricopeptide (TPR) repeat protein [Kibdelosporangium banguiense]|uniref:Tetratricopeptide (TPR) repeat protein n=1 Tax=Kibdelosporangium banguiense TaxID=1365924 RepID=A0ABS4TS51_9PSEU|nr:tetratricopeptide (TPR) repeat protein [Kibdelosporangium banguiense]